MTPTLYDQYAYEIQAQAFSFPGRMAAAGRLLGMQPGVPEAARVLEIGCGHGVNLLWIAQSLPRSRCLGVDLAASGIRFGAKVASDLCMSNVEFLCADIMALDRELGEFDYVIAHGVYSWVPAAVRDRLLGLCAECLAPGGIALVSYNAYPGNHLADIQRRIMKTFVARTADPAERVARARAAFNFVAGENDRNRGTFYLKVLQELRGKLEDIPDALLFHDDLAEENAPQYVADFIAHAERHGLHYLAEADLDDATIAGQ